MSFDFKQVRLKPLMSKERIIELRGAITREVFLHEALAKYIRRLVGRDAAIQRGDRLAPSLAVGAGREVRRSRRVAARDDLLGAAGESVGAARCGERAEVYPEDVQDLAKYVLGHRVWLGPHAASHGVTAEMVIDDIVDRVPVP